MSSVAAAEEDFGGRQMVTEMPMEYSAADEAEMKKFKDLNNQEFGGRTLMDGGRTVVDSMMVNEEPKKKVCNIL
jgi:hypothetical protein